MASICYSKYDPTYYQATLTPSGRFHPMCLALAADPGLWNLAWLSHKKPFDDYENDAIPSTHKPLLLDGAQFARRLGATIVDGKCLAQLAASLPASLVLARVVDANLVAWTIDEKQIPNWLKFAKRRAKTSADRIVDDEVFMAPEELSRAARADIAFQQTLRAPTVPLVMSPVSRRKVTFNRWLGKVCAEAVT